MNHSTLILGLGNDLLRDDGVGLAAARLVAELVGEEADLEEACLATIDLLPLLSGYRRVLVVDGWLSEDRPPGSPVHVSPDQLPRGFGYRSFHSLPFGEMLRLGRLLDLPMPDEIAIHGLAVEDPRTFGYGFTPAVERSWRAWARTIASMEFGQVRQTAWR